MSKKFNIKDVLLAKVSAICGPSCDYSNLNGTLWEKYSDLFDVRIQGDYYEAKYYFDCDDNIKYKVLFTGKIEGDRLVLKTYDEYIYENDKLIVIKKYNEKLNLTYYEENGMVSDTRIFPQYSEGELGERIIKYSDEYCKKYNTNIVEIRYNDNFLINHYKDGHIERIEFVQKSHIY